MTVPPLRRPPVAVAPLPTGPGRPAGIRWALVALLAVACGCSSKPPGYPYVIESPFGVDDPQFARTMGHLLGPPLDEGNAVTTLVDGDQIFPAMLEAIGAARKTITFETYIYWEGETGRRFTDALCDRARAGVKVHLLIDAVGSARIDEHYLEALRGAGAEVELYHQLRWFDISSAAKLNNRTHRKLLVVDGRVGFTGGVGIADEWSGHAQDPQHWHDLHYRAVGPVVSQLQAAFADHWIEATGRVLQGDDYFPPQERAGGQWAQVFMSAAGGSGSESMQLMYLLSLAAARRHIRIGSAYFVPDELTINTLLAARGRGVRVQVIVPGPQTDVPITRDASRAKWGEMLRAGVEIFEYQPTMYHCKLLVVDDRWVSVGSANMDNRSFRVNAEANLNVLDIAFAAEQAKVFDADLKRCHQVTYEEWDERPFGEKCTEWMASWFSWLL